MCKKNETPSPSTPNAEGLTTVEKLGFFVPITLGMLTAFGPFVTDVYLPAMPSMVEAFNTSPAMLSLSLTAGMIGLAVGQLAIGPLSDKYGRKPLLILSMTIFSVASLLCMLTTNIHVFNVLRLFQGFGGAGGVALAKSVSSDMYSGRKLINFMALLGAINGISPVFAPIVGGGIASFASWQGVFCFLLVIGIVLLACCCRLRETLVPERRTTSGMLSVYGNLFKVFHNRRFTLCTLSMMAAFVTFFGYVSASPFIFQQIHDLTALEFSLCFGLNALMIGIGAMLGARFHHPNTALKWASIDLAVSAMLVAICQWANAPLAVLMPCYVYMLLSFGLMQPVCTSIALDSERERAGAASAVFGSFNFVAGAIAVPLVSVGNILISSGLVMLAGALLCLSLTLPLCSALKREGMAKAAQ